MKMNKSNITDDGIKRLVQSRVCEIPPETETALDKKLAARSVKAAEWRRKRLLLALPSAAFLFVILVLSFRAAKSASPQLLLTQKDHAQEIKTEIELVNKNIKIVWFQKSNIQLRIE